MGFSPPAPPLPADAPEPSGGVAAAEEGPTAALLYDENPTLENSSRARRLVRDHFQREFENTRIEGTVQVGLFIDAEGNVDSTRVDVTSGNERLDEEALIVARGVKFNPAKNRGNPVAVWVTWMISYDP